MSSILINHSFIKICKKNERVKDIPQENAANGKTRQG
jgi:hypothetical protein